MDGLIYLQEARVQIIVTVIVFYGTCYFEFWFLFILKMSQMLHNYCC